MKSGTLVPAALVMMMVVTAFLATNASAVPDRHLQFSTEGEGNYEGLCCDNCGTCTFSIPPLCTCYDNLLLACPSWCKTCVKSPYAIYPERYICKDRIANYCEKRCTPKTLISSIVE